MSQEQWHSQEFAEHWDKTALVGNPVRAEQLDMLISLLTATYQQGKAILDLGIGSGLVEESIFTRRPDAYIVGVDSSAAMLNLARRRLAAYSQQLTLIEHDLSTIERLTLPVRQYQVVISIQALHHLPHHLQQQVFRFVFDTLESNGMFVLMDRIAFDRQHFSQMYKTMWSRLERVRATKSNWSADYALTRLQGKGDYPAILEDQLQWLREAGFYAMCLHLHLDRALFIGVK